MVTIDSETLFNVAAAIVATIALVFFVFNVDLGYSPVTELALVLAFLACVFAISQRTDDRQLTVLGYGVIVVSVVAVFFDLVNTFDAGDELTVLGLLLIAAVLFGLRTRLDEDSHFVSGRWATTALVIVAVLAAGVLVVDLATGSLQYELQPEAAVQFGDDVRRDEVRIASVVVSNPTPLPEKVEAPRYGACAVGNWSAYRHPAEPGDQIRPVRVHASVQDGYNEHVFGFGTKTYPVVLYVDGANLDGETFTVHRTDSCPDDETGTPSLAVYEGDDGGPGRFAL